MSSKSKKSLKKYTVKVTNPKSGIRYLYTWRLDDRPETDQKAYRKKQRTIYQTEGLTGRQTSDMVQSKMRWVCEGRMDSERVQKILESLQQDYFDQLAGMTSTEERDNLINFADEIRKEDYFWETYSNIYFAKLDDLMIKHYMGREEAEHTLRAEENMEAEKIMRSDGCNKTQALRKYREKLVKAKKWGL